MWVVGAGVELTSAPAAQRTPSAGRRPWKKERRMGKRPEEKQGLVVGGGSAHDCTCAGPVALTIPCCHLVVLPPPLPPHLFPTPVTLPHAVS